MVVYVEGTGTLCGVLRGDSCNTMRLVTLQPLAGGVDSGDLVHLVVADQVGIGNGTCKQL